MDPFTEWGAVGDADWHHGLVGKRKNKTGPVLRSFHALLIQCSGYRQIARERAQAGRRKDGTDKNPQRQRVEAQGE